MKVLYALQGTGNGHLSRARDLVPALAKNYEIDVLVSGNQGDIDLNFPVKYRFHGLSFIFGINGGVDVWETFKNFSPLKLFKEYRSLNLTKYDFVINDFEPLTAWWCKKNKIPYLACSHQFALLGTSVPKPKKQSRFGNFVLRNYAPALQGIGFHFKSYSPNISLPIIRQEIRELKPTQGEHFTVYLPAYSDQTIIKVLNHFKNIKWEVFSKNAHKDYNSKNVEIKPINNKNFIASMASCCGVLCGAGFETPAEALFLTKKLLVVPMTNQYEQQCNAISLSELGIQILESFDENNLNKIEKWLQENQNIQINFEPNTEQIIQKIQHTHFL